jgi:hypothetical protein
MTTTRTYKYGKHTCKAYKKPVGKGFEVGFTFGATQIFVGNFIHAKEATAWWGMMNNEVKRFSKRYGMTAKAPVGWYSKFLSHHIYKVYYNHLDKQFSKYQKGYTKAFRRDERQYTHMKRHWPTKTMPMSFRRAA